MHEAIKFKNEAVRMSFDTTIEHSDVNQGRAKHNVTDLKIAVNNLKIAPPPPMNHSLLTQRQYLNMSSIEAQKKGIKGAKGRSFDARNLPLPMSRQDF